VSAEPEPFSIEEAARRAAAVHEQRGGSSFSVREGDLWGRDLYAVSPYLDRTLMTPGATIDEQQVRAYLRKNWDLLGDGSHHFGSWYDRTTDRTYLDVSVTVADRDEAIRLGRRHNQKAVFSLKDGREIEIGGTGEVE
jgi:hypothetical protein